MNLLEQRTQDINTIIRGKMLQNEGYHDSSIFCQIVRAFQASREYQGLCPEAFAEVLCESLIAQGLKTRDRAVICGYLVTSNYNYDSFIDGEREEAVMPTLPEWVQSQIRDYLDSRFDYPM